MDKEEGDKVIDEGLHQQEVHGNQLSSPSMQDQNGQVAEYKNMNIRAHESVGTLLKNVCIVPQYHLLGNTQYNYLSK